MRYNCIEFNVKVRPIIVEVIIIDDYGLTVSIVTVVIERFCM